MKVMIYTRTVYDKIESLGVSYPIKTVKSSFPHIFPTKNGRNPPPTHTHTMNS